MGVLTVNVGTESEPDWRKIGCGGSAGTVMTYPTASDTVTVYIDATDGTVYAYSNALAHSTTQVLNIDIHSHDYYLTLLSGSVTGHAVWSVANDPANTVGAGDSIAYVRERLSDLTYLGDASWTPSTVQADTPATSGRLKLWDGTRWMREACDDDPTVPTLGSTGATNLLTGNNATGDTGVGAWVRDPASTFNSTRVTLETGIMRTGAGCIRLDNNNGSGDARMILPSGLFAASLGDHHWFSCWGRDQDNVWHRNVGIEYLDSSGAVLATAQTVYPNNSANVYRQLTHWNTAGAPAGTAWVRPFVGFGASTGGYYTMIDDAELRTAVVLGTDRHPLKGWDGTAWQTLACMVPVD